MTNNALEKFEALFKDFDSLSMDKIEQLVHESLKFFEALKEKLQSPNEEERKEAQQIALEIQKKLEEQAEKAFKATGLTRSELDAFLSTQQNFTNEEWNTLERTQKELSEYNTSLYRQGHSAAKAAAPKKAKRVSINKIQG